jgi:hypothetical protein
MMRNSKPAPASAMTTSPIPLPATETPVARARRSMLAKMDAQHQEITRLVARAAGGTHLIVGGN